MVVSTRPCSAQKSTSSGIRAMPTLSLVTISESSPAGESPARRQRSTVASVWPLRSRTPPALARSGKMCPGRKKLAGVLSGSARARRVVALSVALMPVVVPTLQSTVRVKAVFLGS